MTTILIGIIVGVGIGDLIAIVFSVRMCAVNAHGIQNKCVRF